MEKLVDEGLTKHIGVSNFNLQQVTDLCKEARIKPVCNQVAGRCCRAEQRAFEDVCAHAWSRAGLPGCCKVCSWAAVRRAAGCVASCGSSCSPAEHLASHPHALHHA